MIFNADKQTKEDLGIFSKGKTNSVFNIFNKTATHGGSSLLKEMFEQPLSNSQEINNRSNLICTLAINNIEFPYRNDLFDVAEFYLSNTDSRSRINLHEDNLERKFKSLTGSDQNYKHIKKGAESILEILYLTKEFVNQIQEPTILERLSFISEPLASILKDDAIDQVVSLKRNPKLNYGQIVMCDQAFRFTSIALIRKLLSQIYLLDVYITVGRIQKSQNFSFAHAKESDQSDIVIQELFHPLLEKPVSNSISISRSHNIIFLTGANMAGKSTFMKSLGISVYLAHMGFPIPAGYMTFPVLEGIFTTINLPDNIGMGYSHFYAEVMRIKKVAESLSRSKKIIVIFDELFRGTNVKDAYDATVEVTKAFSAIKDSFFLISTHIIEAGETLGNSCENIDFNYLPTIMDGNIPQYSYKLKKGITSDRHGMLIINNENILDILKN
ncbi:MAG: DNA mismatch repair protein [Bacteroidales bacterium]|jgi:DNA mismatch repair ATPase MutS